MTIRQIQTDTVNIILTIPSNRIKDGKWYTSDKKFGYCEFSIWEGNEKWVVRLATPNEFGGQIRSMYCQVFQSETGYPGFWQEFSNSRNKQDKKRCEPLVIAGWLTEMLMLSRAATIQTRLRLVHLWETNQFILPKR